MGYRIVADEHVEPASRQFLLRLGHDVVWIGDVRELGLSSTDDAIAAYSLAEDRLVLTQDTDFIFDIDQSECAGILFQPNQSLSTREVGDIIDEMARYIPQSGVSLEYVSRGWL